jgi:hypothetical protein
MEKHVHRPTFNAAKREFDQDFQKVKEKTCEACGAISETAQHASNNAREVLRSSISDLQNSQENIVQYIQAHPVKSVSWAFLAGLIGAKLL